jgi:hypothetical protein
MVVTNILLARVVGDLENRVEVLQEHEDSWDGEGRGFHIGKKSAYLV